MGIQVASMTAPDELLLWCTDGDDVHVRSSLMASKIGEQKIKHSEKNAALHAAVINGHHRVADVLLSFDVDVDCKAQSGYTPLHFAASKGHLNCAKVLLKHNANIYAQDSLGNTPTDLAKKNAKSAVAKLLMSEGK